MIDEQSSCCCAARRQEGQTSQNTMKQEADIAPATVISKMHIEHMISLQGGTFLIGTDSKEGFPKDGEGPTRMVEVSPFSISAYTITNEQYADFVKATGYKTEAEQFGWSYVFEALIPEHNLKESVGSPTEVPWWYGIKGAYWYSPEGPGTSIEGRENHPVVHISWNDAQAYCQWIGGRLPTEAEWEFAARGGLEGKRYPWGDELHPNKEHFCNIWQGKFPVKNHGLDGYIGTAPVDAYQPNGYGLYNVSGNVWEWCLDYFHPRYHLITDSKDPIYTENTGVRSMRGGSYLCHRSYCNRYRVAARNQNTPDSSSGHCGFRVVIAEK